MGQLAPAEFLDGRWHPNTVLGQSVNFSFFAETEPDLYYAASMAEHFVSLDPNAALFRLRQFAEVLARRLCEMHRIDVDSSDTLHELLRRLQRRLPRKQLDCFHDIKNAGNAAAHSLYSDAPRALHLLKQAHLLAGWYHREMHTPNFRPQRFEAPRNHIKQRRKQEAQSRALGAQLRERQEGEAKQRRRAQELDRQLAGKEAELETQRVAIERAREDRDQWQELAIAESEAAAGALAKVEHLQRVESLRRDLLALKLDVKDSAGLPDWVAAVARGAEPPTELPDELVEDIRTFGKHLVLPRRVNPKISVNSTGTLVASGAPLRVNVELKAPSSLSPAVRMGTTWTTAEGESFLMDPSLAAVLDELEGALPEGRSRRETTQLRELWWGRLRRRLSAFDVTLCDYLASSDAVVVERFVPTLSLDDEGLVELKVAAEHLDADELTAKLDTLNPRALHNPTLVWQAADGTVHRRRVVLSEQARKAVPRIQQIRRSREAATPYLLQDPATILDTNAFDLSEYGDRVVGLGVSVYRANPVLGGGGDAGEGQRLSLKDDLERLGEVGCPPPSLSPAEERELAEKLNEAARMGQHYIRFKNAWIRVPSEQGASALVEAVEGEAPARKGVLIIDENLEGTQYRADDAGIGVCADVPLPPPGLKRASLLPHQRIGFAWLAGHALVGPDATDHGLIADEMGLGKTLQVLSLMALLEDQGELAPALVVAPLSLLQNWEAEADRFFPGRFRRRARLHGGARLKAAQLASADIVLASYEAVRSQQLELGRVAWQVMVCDESHRIRNPTTQTAKAVMAMDAKRRIAMTGTPVQNSLDDLWSQFDWLQPGLLGDLKSFRAEFSAKATTVEHREALSTLRERVGPRMLRRVKAEVATDLPPKQIHRITLPLSTSQVELYGQVLSEVNEVPVLSVLHRLFQVCSYPEGAAAAKLAVADNAKLCWLLSLLEEIRKRGEKAVVFAEWYALQDQLSMAITQRFGVSVDRINGRVAANHRQWKVDTFNRSEGFGVLTLGPKAAGVGLNITSANHVIHYTRHWNPALEAQATDRCHRIGQKLPVHVYLPVATHPETTTVEQHLNRLLEQKSALARDVITPTETLSVERGLKASIRQRREQ